MDRLKVRRRLGPVSRCRAHSDRARRRAGKHFSQFLADLGVTDEALRRRGSLVDAPGGESMIFSLLPPVRLERVLSEVFAEDNGFLSQHGLRALSRRHRDQPFRIEVEGYLASID